MFNLTCCLMQWAANIPQPATSLTCKHTWVDGLILPIFCVFDEVMLILHLKKGMVGCKNMCSHAHSSSKPEAVHVQCSGKKSGLKWCLNVTLWMNYHPSSENSNSIKFSSTFFIPVSMGNDMSDLTTGLEVMGVNPSGGVLCRTLHQV